MLKGIDHRLNADLLQALRAMGHGDMLMLTDVNFPGAALAPHTVAGRLLTMENLTAAEAARAILSVLPLDTFVHDFAARMEVVGDPAAIPPVQAEVQAEIDRAEGRPRPMTAIDRFAYYDLAKQAFVLVQTGERRLYGCFMFRKGVIMPTE
ncbi:RbsD/FucU family protein [Tabrizicola oligotrophica]|uniref:Ribose ABC transporter n=1 Tax=Tabrizicola oligotrophica TaxID=2710650 RepID=A0A6M0QPW7_9RHOB|nr:RbsD/FucU domain-containing protein [Tabrizicola oligotrophica]NEY89386.1 ribose ABC transporter [Tabrizicola oligotrophica]